jgi:hypothetical protein
MLSRLSLSREMFDGDFESKCCIARQQQLERLEA